MSTKPIVPKNVPQPAVKHTSHKPPRIIVDAAAAPAPKHAGAVKAAGATKGVSTTKGASSTKPVAATKPKVSAGSAAATPTTQDSMGQVRKSVLFLIVVIVAYALYLVFSGQFDEFMRAMRNVNRGWIFGALLCYLCYFLLGTSAFILSVIKDKTNPVGVRDLMGVEAAGIFFMNLTPNGAGAAPAQIFRLMRSGLSIGQAGALQYTRFIIYEAAEGVFAALMLIFRGAYFYETFGDVTIIGLSLFGFKIIQVLFMLAICLKPRMALALANGVVSLGAKIKLIKNPQKALSSVTGQIGEFSSGFKSAAKNVPEMFATLGVTLLQLGCLYALPYFVLRALSLPADLLTCLASGSMLELLTSAIPLPGGTGGAEGGFAFLFAHLFGADLAAGFVLWRSVEYFLPTLAASTLLGLRSTTRTPIAIRWQRERARLKSRYERLVNGKTAPVAGITVKPQKKATGTRTAKQGVKTSAQPKAAAKPEVTVKPKAAAKPKTAAKPSTKPSAITASSTRKK